LKSSYSLYSKVAYNINKFKINNNLKKVFGISGWSGSGKTTLVKKLIKFFTEECNLKVCAIKHAHENFEIDHKGKDTYEFAKAGAKKVIVSSSKKLAVIDYNHGKKTIDNILELSGAADIVLVEGWKNSRLKKIEIYRDSIKKPILYKNDMNFIAVASDNPNLKLERKIMLLNLNNVQQIANFIIENN